MVQINPTGLILYVTQYSFLIQYSDTVISLHPIILTAQLHFSHFFRVVLVIPLEVNGSMMEHGVLGTTQPQISSERQIRLRGESQTAGLTCSPSESVVINYS